jgi:hypothetical protein
MSLFFLTGVQRSGVLPLAASAIAVSASVVLAFKAPTAFTAGERRPDIHDARVVCERFKSGNQIVTRYCQDGYECDLANQRCVPGPEIRQRMEAERERQEQERQRLNAELDRMRQRLEEQQRSMRRDFRRFADATQRLPGQQGSADWRRIPSPQYGRPNPGGCSTISGLPGDANTSAGNCGSGRGGTVHQTGPDSSGGTVRVYQPPRPSPTPDPRLLWRQQQAQWNDYLRRVGDAIARTEPGDPARQALVAHRAEARKAFEEQNKVHVTEELPHDDMVDSSGRSTSTAAAQQGDDQSGQAGRPPGAVTGVADQTNATSKSATSARAGERDLLAEEEACARARDRATRGNMALFAVADVPTQCLAEVNQLRAEAAARAGIDPAPLFLNSIDREIIRRIQNEFRPERPDAGPPDTRQKS